MVSSHILGEMQLMCDRVGIIDKGRLIDIKDVHDLGGGKDENGFMPFIFKIGYSKPAVIETDLITAPEPVQEDPLAEEPAYASVELVNRALAALPAEFADRIRATTANSFTLMATEAEVQQTVAALMAAKIPLIGLDREQTSLEDLYMAVTGGGLEIA